MVVPDVQKVSQRLAHGSKSKADSKQFYKNGTQLLQHHLRWYNSADPLVLHKEARERRESKGLKCSQKDLPGETSFERQLSG